MNHSLIKTFPELLQAGTVKMAPVAVEVEHMNVPLLDVGIQRQFLPLDVETADCTGKENESVRCISFCIR